jgi:Hg(II)-responsive transcriptional regulator
METGLKIGEVAARAGVNVQTLRFYERRGLLEEPPRRASGYRQYPEESVQLVRFIKRAQELGFSLDEVQELLALREARKASCSQVKRAAEAKLAAIERKLEQLEAMRGALKTLVSSCSRRGSLECPILESLDRKNTGPVSKARA